MKMLLVENDASSVLNFIQVARAERWDCTFYGLELPAESGELCRFLRSVCEVRPDVLVIDIALSTEEEARIDDASLEHVKVDDNVFSGFKYCRALVEEHWNIPIVLLTVIESANVTRAAMKAGADRVLVKNMQAGDLLREVTDIVRSKAAHDPEFFWQLSDSMAVRSDMWQSSTMEQALNRFFLNASSVRRFGLFTATLRGILSPLFQGDVDVEKKLMLSLVRSQVLLSLVDPRLRDHVKHTGNVFWMGYRLVHEIPVFEEPQVLPGSDSALYDLSGTLTPREQLLHAWTLAALFHDFGYVDERQEQLVGLVSGLLPNSKVELTDVRNERSWDRNIPALLDFVERLVGRGHFLHHFIKAVYASFGTRRKCRGSKGEESALVDHGFLSAHRLLDMVSIDRLDAQKRNCVLHAALAIACHNHVEMLDKWDFPPQCRGRLRIGAFPVCSLLAFCDSVQTWDRELDEVSVTSPTDVYDGLLERLVLSSTAYVSGSEIREFTTRRREDSCGYYLKLSLRYFIEAGGGVKEVCENLCEDIQRWIDSGRLREVCDMTGLSSLLHGQIVYELPMQTGSRNVTF